MPLKVLPREQVIHAVTGFDYLESLYKKRKKQAEEIGREEHRLTGKELAQFVREVAMSETILTMANTFVDLGLLEELPPELPKPKAKWWQFWKWECWK